MTGVPARDLMPEDLLEIEEREGIGVAELEASGLYVVMEDVEVAPFCGAALEGGGRCETRVSEWGQQCEEHGGQG